MSKPSERTLRIRRRNRKFGRLRFDDKELYALLLPHFNRVVSAGKVLR